MNAKLLAIILASAFVSSASAQDNHKFTTCEVSSGVFDAALNKATAGDVLILIARLGTKENDKTLNDRRLANAETYLTKYHGLTIFTQSARTLVTAVGKKASGLGVIEIYFKGTLFATLYVPHNKDLFVGECARDLQIHKDLCDVPAQKVFFPCRSR